MKLNHVPCFTLLSKSPQKGLLKRLSTLTNINTHAYRSIMNKCPTAAIDARTAQLHVIAQVNGLAKLLDELTTMLHTMKQCS